MHGRLSKELIGKSSRIEKKGKKKKNLSVWDADAARISPDPVHVSRNPSSPSMSMQDTAWRDGLKLNCRERSSSMCHRTASSVSWNQSKSMSLNGYTAFMDGPEWH